MVKVHSVVSIVKDTVYSERISFRDFTKMVVVAPSGWSGGLMRIAVAATPTTTPSFLYDAAGTVVHLFNSISLVGGDAYEVPPAPIGAALNVYLVSSSVSAAADATFKIFRA